MKMFKVLQTTLLSLVTPGKIPLEDAFFFALFGLPFLLIILLQIIGLIEIILLFVRRKH